MSAQKGRAVDAQGQPVPWITYAAAALLEERVRADWRVFEYGAGGSTAWWAARVREVVAVEHEAEWHHEVTATAAANTTVHLRALTSADYASIISAEGHFDVVVIDGRRRAECAEYAVGALTDRGVILWDNSERPEYAEAMERVSQAGFRRLDLHGLGPVNAYAWCTSFFYRDGNCLGL